MSEDRLSMRVEIEKGKGPDGNMQLWMLKISDWPDIAYYINVAPTKEELADMLSSLSETVRIGPTEDQMKQVRAKRRRDGLRMAELNKESSE